MSRERGAGLFGLVGACLLTLGASLVLAACGSGGDAGEEQVGSGHHAAGDHATAGTAGTGQKAVPIQERDRRGQARVRRRRQAIKPPTPDEAEAKQTVRSFYAAIATQDAHPAGTTGGAASFCGLMSKEARAQTVGYVRRASGLRRQWNCETAVEQLMQRAKRSGALKGLAGARVVGVNADGDRATVTVRFGHHRGSLPLVTSIPLVKEGGVWKLGSAPTPPPGS